MDRGLAIRKQVIGYSQSQFDPSEMQFIDFSWTRFVLDKYVKAVHCNYNIVDLSQIWKTFLLISERCCTHQQISVKKSDPSSSLLPKLVSSSRLLSYDTFWMLNSKWRDFVCRIPLRFVLVFLSGFCYIFPRFSRPIMPQICWIQMWNFIFLTLSFVTAVCVPSIYISI